VLLPTPCHMPPREKARHSKSASRSGSRHSAPQPSVLALEGRSACIFEISAATPSVSLIFLQMTFTYAMQRQRLYSNEPSVSEGGKPFQPMSRLRWVKLMQNFELYCQPVSVGLMLLSSFLQSNFRRALDLEQRSPLPFERHCDAYFGLVG